MLFAVELPDGTVYLVTADNVAQATEQGHKRSGVWPEYVWTFTGVRRRKV